MAEEKKTHEKAGQEGGQEKKVSQFDMTALREGILEKPQSVWKVYGRRFSKHTLGKIGLIILLVLYGAALLADFISPYSMVWADKTKPYHPPSRIYIEDGKMFSYEQRVINQGTREYGVIPERSIRVLTTPNAPAMRELRFTTTEATAGLRSSDVLGAIQSFYRLEDGGAEMVQLTQALRELELDRDPDARLEIDLGPEVTAGGVELDRKLTLAKGNKNFLGFFQKGIPYHFLGFIETDVHLFTSDIGGFYIWGSDAQGRDLLSRLLHGSRISLTVGLIGSAITFAIGLLLGGIAGYAGGKIDDAIMRLTEVIISIPSIYLLFALRAALPQDLNSIQVYLIIVVILSLTAWANVARVIRGLILSIKNEDYVLSARTMGLSHGKIIRKHVLPNTMSYIIIQLTLSIPSYILGESALSLLGLGISEPQSSWGLMLAVGRNFRVINDFPWILIPGFFIFLSILAWNFVGDGVRDALDPKSKH